MKIGSVPPVQSESFQSTDIEDTDPDIALSGQLRSAKNNRFQGFHKVAGGKSEVNTFFNFPREEGSYTTGIHRNALPQGSVTG